MFKKRLLCLMVIFLKFGTAMGYGGSSGNGVGETGCDDKDKQGGLNVVIFFADVSSNFTSEVCEIPHLKFPLIGKVKPCVSENESSFKRYSNKMCDCSKCLQSSILSLNRFAQGAAGMTTAVVSLTKNEMTDKNDNGMKYYSYKLETIETGTPKTPSQESQQTNDNNEIVIGDSKKCNQNPLSKQQYHRQMSNLNQFDNREPSGSSNLRDFPLFNLNTLPETNFKFNNLKYQPHQQHHKMSEPNAGERFRRDYLIEPENTQIFEIESAVKQNPNELYANPVRRDDSKRQSLFNVLGLMKLMRNSFFSNYMTPMLDPQQRMADEENGMDYSGMGKHQDLSLFQLVKKTLSSLKQDAKGTNKGGFLMVVFGGNFSEISCPKSDLLQSVKYIVESTDSKRTLIIVTGNCPSEDESMGQSNGNPNQSINIPIFTKGPQAKSISKSRQLSDIPKQIKEVLNKNGKGPRKLKFSNFKPLGENLFDGDAIAANDESTDEKERVKRYVPHDLKDTLKSPRSSQDTINKFQVYILFIIFLCIVDNLPN